MADLTPQLDHVTALANRLRVLQVDFADQGEQVRREYLAEEVRRALGTVPPNERKTFIEELQARFPTWDGKVEVSQNAARPTFDETELKDPSFLLTRLIEVSKSLSESQRRTIGTRLMEAGLIPAPTGTAEWPPAALSDAKTKLQLSANDGIHAGRALELLSQLADFVFTLDRIAWMTWKALAPNSSIRRPAALQNTVGRFVSGDAAIGRDQLVNELKVLRQLTGALVGALSQIGRFAAQYFRSVSPEEIQVLVGPKKLMTGEAAYWRKYVELAGSMDSGDNISDAIRNALAGFVEAQIQGADSNRRY